MAKKKKTGKARKKTKAKAKDLSPKSASTRMIVGGRRSMLST